MTGFGRQRRPAWSWGVARIYRYVASLLLCAIALAAQTHIASAQVVTVAKALCDGQETSLSCNPTANPGLGETVYYKLTFTSGPGSPIFPLAEELPPEFQPSDPTTPLHCRITAGFGAGTPVFMPAVNYTNSTQPPFAFGAMLPAMPAAQTIVCTIEGYFAVTGATVGAVNEATTNPGTPEKFEIAHNASASEAMSVADLEIIKTIESTPIANLLASPAGPKQVTYKILIKAHNHAVTLGDYFELFDKMGLQQSGVPLSATLVTTPPPTCSVFDLNGQPVVTGLVCLDVSQNLSGTITAQYPATQDFLRWAPNAPITIPKDGWIELVYTIEFDQLDGLDCVIAQNSDGVRNIAFLGLQARPGDVIQDVNPANNTDPNGNGDNEVEVITGATVVDPDCGADVIPTGGTGTVPQFVPPPPILKIEKEGYLPSDWTSNDPAQPPGTSSGSLGNLLDWIAYSLGRIWLCLSGLVDSLLEHIWCSDVTYYVRVTNISTGQTASAIRLSDIVEELASSQTPAFQATLKAATWLDCPTTSTCATVSTVPVTESLIYYGDTALMLTGVISQLQAGESAMLRVVLNYCNESCDGATANQPKYVRNIARAEFNLVVMNTITNQLESVPYTIRDHTDTKMATPPKCEFVVEKTGPAAITFGVNQQYTVDYKNLGGKPVQIGTLIDALRISVPGYAAPLEVSYTFSCTDIDATGTPLQADVTGFTAHNANFGTANGAPPGYDTAFVYNYAFPHQGTRIIQQSLQNGQNGYVTFAPGAILRCVIDFIVRKPPASDPFCLSWAESEPQLENLALMDVSLFYNTNLPWPPSNAAADDAPTNWAIVGATLPKCMNLVVNKESSFTSVAPGGGPITFKVTVTNSATTDIFGTAGSSPWVGPGLSDVFTPAGTPSSISVVCPPSSPNCAEVLGVGAFPQVGIVSLPQGESMEVTYTLPGPYAPNEVCNEATVVMFAPNADLDWYVKDGRLTHAKACVPVRAALSVNKRILNATGLPTPASSFTFTVACDAPAAGGLSDRNETVQVTEAQPALVSFIPVGSICTITESAAPDPALPAGCKWTIEGPKTVVADGSVNPHEVWFGNRLTCDPMGSVHVTKTIANSAQLAVPLEGVFPVTLTCLSGGTTTTHPLSFTNGPATPHLSEVVGNIPMGSTCSIAEQTPALPVGFCHWETSYPQGDTVQVSAQSPNALEVKNDLVCDAGLAISKTYAHPPGVNAPQDMDFDFAVVCHDPNNVNATPVQGTAKITSGQANFDFIPNLPAGWTCTLTESVPTTTGLGGCHWVVNGITPNPVTINAAPMITLVEATNEYVCPQPILGEFEVSKSCDICLTGVGCKCKITVTSNSQTLLTGPITISEGIFREYGSGAGLPDAGTTFTAISSAGPWACPATPTTSNPLTCTMTAADFLAQGNSSTIDVTFDMAQADVFETKNCVMPVFAGGVGSTMCVHFTSSLSIVKTGPRACGKGKDCSFTIVITNTHPSAAIDSDVTVSDSLASGTAAIASITPVLCTPTPTQVPFSCQAHVTLAPGQSQTYTVVLTTPPSTSGPSFTNCATLSSGTAGGPDPQAPGEIGKSCATVVIPK